MSWVKTSPATQWSKEVGGKLVSLRGEIESMAWTRCVDSVETAGFGLGRRRNWYALDVVVAVPVGGTEADWGVVADFFKWMDVEDASTLRLPLVEGYTIKTQERHLLVALVVDIAVSLPFMTALWNVVDAWDRARDRAPSPTPVLPIVNTARPKQEEVVEEDGGEESDEGVVLVVSDDDEEEEDEDEDEEGDEEGEEGGEGEGEKMVMEEVVEEGKKVKVGLAIVARDGGVSLYGMEPFHPTDFNVEL